MSLIPYKRKPNLVRTSPFTWVGDLQSDLNRFFDDSLLDLAKSGLPEDLSDDFYPDTDIYDSEDKLVVKTDLPGMSKEDIELSVQGNTLFIKGEKKHEEDIQDKGFIKSERFFGYFERALPLSKDIDPNKIDASFKDGVLSVEIAKKEEAKPKQITVKVK